jgi:hypothetical protein
VSRSNPSLREIGAAVIERGVRTGAGGAWRADAVAGILRAGPASGMAPLGAGPSFEMAALDTPEKPLQVHHTGPQGAPFEDHQRHLRSPLAAPARRHRGSAGCGQKITDTGIVEWLHHGPPFLSCSPGEFAQGEQVRNVFGGSLAAPAR